MKMISKIMRSMRDTGLLEEMSDEDLDTVATAALEGMRERVSLMVEQGEQHLIGTDAPIWVSGSIYRTMIDAAINE